MSVDTFAPCIFRMRQTYVTDVVRMHLEIFIQPK
uniref:Uncharacterized protein n=1 Tax=Anguilla anguilla TaxID=7936 RepID=A0A0E9TVR4_ANGAN